MFEGSFNRGKSPEPASEKISLSKIDTMVADTIESLAATGLNMAKWNAEYEDLPNEVAVFEAFYDKLQNFREKRRDALSSLEFAADVSPEEMEKLRQFDREVMLAFKDHDNFLGNGATAEVYAMRENDAYCVKFITDQARYNENNSIRVEFERLSQVYEQTKGATVRAPHPKFLRIHPKEGHAYGMEKIHGASLSQILETPDKYPELITLAKAVDRTAVQADLQSFVSQMHEGGVTHCDLYKRNIMLDRDGRLCVIDFGKAKVIDYKGDREDERKSDIYNAQQSLRDFFVQLDGLTN